MIEVKAFLNTQQLLELQTENVDQVLPMLVAARERHAQLVHDVQMLNVVCMLSFSPSLFPRQNYYYI